MMKPAITLIVVVALAVAAFISFQHGKAHAAKAAQTSAPVTPDPSLARRELFGPEALSPEVKWLENGFGYRILQPGTPPKPGLGTPVRLNYVGRLKDGTVFDRSEKPAEFTVGRTISGLSTGLQMLGTGGKAVFLIPPAQGYGSRKVAGIPPDSALIFEVEVLAVNP
jgi:FKBP-type peptidyl-prolyl cis-trans isomerase